MEISDGAVLPKHGYFLRQESAFQSVHAVGELLCLARAAGFLCMLKLCGCRAASAPALGPGALP